MKKISTPRKVIVLKEGFKKYANSRVSASVQTTTSCKTLAPIFPPHFPFFRLHVTLSTQLKIPFLRLKLSKFCQRQTQAIRSRTTRRNSLVFAILLVKLTFAYNRISPVSRKLSPFSRFNQTPLAQLSTLRPHFFLAVKNRNVYAKSLIEIAIGISLLSYVILSLILPITSFISALSLRLQKKRILGLQRQTKPFPNIS